jgi:hypothetical protein
MGAEDVEDFDEAPTERQCLQPSYMKRKLYRGLSVMMAFSCDCGVGYLLIAEFYSNFRDKIQAETGDPLITSDVDKITEIGHSVARSLLV